MEVLDAAITTPEALELHVIRFKHFIAGDLIDTEALKHLEKQIPWTAINVYNITCAINSHTAATAVHTAVTKLTLFSKEAPIALSSCSLCNCCCLSLLSVGGKLACFGSGT